jgi:hypothetical protein
MSIVVDDIERRFLADATVGVAYIFCDYKTRDSQTIDLMLRSLLKQLVGGTDSLPASIGQFYADHNHGNRRPAIKDLAGALQVLVASFSKVFIMIDALDECRVEDACRSSLLSEIFGLQGVSRTNVLATSRHTPEIVDVFGADLLMEIRATTNDVRTFVEGNMDSLPKFVRNNTDLQDQIKSKIAESVDGM